MKTKNFSCNAKVEIVANKNAILLVDKNEVQNQMIDFKYNDNVTSLVAKNTANAKIGDVVRLEIKKKDVSLFSKIMYFAPLVFLLVGFLFAIKFNSAIYQLVFAASLFLVGTLLSLVVIAILGVVGKSKFEVVEVIKSAQIDKTENVEATTECASTDASVQVESQQNVEVKND